MINFSGADMRRTRGLTARMRAFAKLVSEGRTPSESYRLAYGCAKSSNATVSANAGKLMKDPRVVEVVTAANGADAIIADHAKLRLYVMRQLLNHASTMKAETSRIRALELLGKTVGMFTDKIETSVEQVNPEQLKADLERRLDELAHREVFHPGT